MLDIDYKEDQSLKIVSRNKRIHNPDLLVNYIYGELKNMSKSEYMIIPVYMRGAIGLSRPIKQRLQKVRFDVLLMLAMYLGKSWFTVIHDRNKATEKSGWDKEFLKNFNYYATSLKNRSADNFIAENNIFISTPRGMMKRLMLSSQVFDSSVYQTATKFESLKKLEKAKNGGNVAGVGDLIRANEAVYSMFFSIIINSISTNFLSLLVEYNINKLQFLALGKMCCSEVPLSIRGLTPNIMSFSQKNSRIMKRLVELDYIEEYNYVTTKSETALNGTIKEKYYTATPKGYQVFYKIVQQVTDYGLIYTNM